jgi:hypothetical protein
MGAALSGTPSVLWIDPIDTGSSESTVAIVTKLIMLSSNATAAFAIKIRYGLNIRIFECPRDALYQPRLRIGIHALTP